MYHADFLAKYFLAGATKNENDFQHEILDKSVNKITMKIVCLEMYLWCRQRKSFGTIMKSVYYSFMFQIKWRLEVDLHRSPLQPIQKSFYSLVSWKLQIIIKESSSLMEMSYMKHS